VERVKQEAQTCLQAIKGKVFEYGVWFDQEYEPAILALTDAQRTELVKTFCQIIEAAGYYTGLYCSREFLRVHLLPAELAHLDLWVAAYSSTPGDVALPYGIWQYTSNGSVAGIGGRVDMNWAYKDYPAITAGKATAADKAPTADPTGDFIREVQAAIGVTVDGIVGPKTRAALPTISALRNRKHKAVKPLQAQLIALGYSCGKKGADGIVGWHTVSAVRAYQKANGLTADGVVGQKTWARLLGI
ncbi:MAG: peptidoglycan-binding protein, partial [Faecalibacterium sp.]|nr:peptidoglycan-binding protein [Faecalibacterium sp.]